MKSNKYYSLSKEKSRRCVQIADFNFREVYYPGNLRMPEHAHDIPFISFVLRGAYHEKIGRHNREVVPNSLIFHTAQESHEVSFREVETRIFRMDFSLKWFLHNKDFKQVFDQPLEFKNGPISWIATRIYTEYKRNDEFSPYSIQGLMLELLANAGRHKQAKKGIRRPPQWLRQVEEMLYEQFDAKTSLKSIASEVSVHPVHLSREFRRQKGCTIGEYVRRRRIEVACQKISLTDMELSDIGESVGFYDQSHFISNFKRLTGFTPGKYRNASRTS